MKNTIHRLVSMLLVLAMVCALPLTALAASVPEAAAAPTAEAENGTVVYQDGDEVISSVSSEGALPELNLSDNAVEVGSDDEYTYYQITDSEAIAALLERYNIDLGSETDATFIETEDEIVTAMVRWRAALL